MQRFFLYFILLCSFINISFAESLEKKIAIVDFHYIYQEALVYKDFNEKIEKKRKELQNDVSKKEAELNKLDQDLAKQRTVLAEEVYLKKLRDHENKIMEYYKSSQSKKMQVDKEASETSYKIHHKLVEIINNIAVEKDYELVLANDNVVYTKDKLDITKEVLKMLNKQITKVSADFK